MILSFLLSIFLLLAPVFSLPTDLELERRNNGVKVLADGKSVKIGPLPNWNLTYGVSGPLSKGGCPESACIKTCYKYSLSSDPKKNIMGSLDDGNKKYQAIMINSQANEAVGQVTKFKFKMHIDKSIKPTCDTPFPIFQLVAKEVDNGPASTIQLDIRSNKASIFAFQKRVASVPLDKILGKTVLQTWIIKGGLNGYCNITLADAKSGKTILSHKVIGENSRDQYRIRIGAERQAQKGMKPFKAYFGDYSATLLSKK